MAGLRNGTMLPSIELPCVGGGVLRLPVDLARGWGVVLAYRGLWCPYCNEQLASFEQHLDELNALGVEVAAFSVDDEADATEMVKAHGLRFKVGYGAQGADTGERFEGYVHERRGSIEPMGFVLRPDSTIAVASYSSGAIGRLVPQDVLRTVRRLQSLD